MTAEEAWAWAFSEEGVRRGRAYMQAPRQVENRLSLLYARADALREGRARVGAGRTREEEMLCVEQETEEALHLLSAMRREREALLDAMVDREVSRALKMYYLEGVSAVAAARRMYVDERSFFRRLHRGCGMAALALALGCTDDKKMV